MRFPGRLQRYDRLIDFLVDELVREAEESAIPETATPPGRGDGGGVNQGHLELDDHDQPHRQVQNDDLGGQRHGESNPEEASAATAAR